MKCKQQAGFTLVELVVGLALMALLMSSIAGVFTALMRHGVQGADLIDRQQEARLAVDMIAADIRYATAFNTPAGAGALVDVVGMDSTNALVRIRYSLVPDAVNGNLVLQRQVFIPSANAVATATNPIGNANRGFVGANDFAITTTVAGTTVTQVKIVYQIRQNAADTSPAVAQTTVFPINGLTPP